MSSQNGFWQEIDGQIIAAAKSGDMQAFKHIYESLGQDCYRLAYRMTQDVQFANDIVQDCFVGLFDKIQQFKGKGSFAGWLRTMVSRHAINKMIGNNKLNTVDRVNDLATDSMMLFEQDWLADRYDVEKLLGLLPEKLRTVLILHEIEGMTHKEIGSYFGQTASFSKINLMRAFIALKQLTQTDQEGNSHAFN